MVDVTVDSTTVDVTATGTAVDVTTSTTPITVASSTTATTVEVGASAVTVDVSSTAPTVSTGASAVTVAVNNAGASSDPGAVWGLVQDTGAEFRADAISTALTHAQRTAVGAAWPDGVIGFETVSAVTYAWASDGDTGLPVRCTYADGVFTGATACTVDVGASGLEYLAGGPVAHDGTRYVMIAHGEDDAAVAAGHHRAHLLHSTDGLAWEWVAQLGTDIDLVSGGMFTRGDWTYLYVTISPANVNTGLIRIDTTDLFAWAAGGAAATVYRRTVSGWSSTSGTMEVLAGPDYPLSAVSTCMFVEEIDRVVAVSHNQGGAVGYELNGYVVDPDSPWLLENPHYLYRTTADEFVDQGSGGTSNIGYVSLAPVASDSTLTVYRVDAMSTTPGDNWGDTVVTGVALRPAVRADDLDRPVMLDGVGTVASATGTTVTVSLPNGDSIVKNIGGDADVLVLALDDIASGWVRYLTRASGGWLRHPLQPTSGDRFQSTVAFLDGDDIVEVAVRDPSSPTGLNVTNAEYSRLVALAGGGTYIYNSAGAASGGNRFDDWSKLMTAISGVEGPRLIVFEQNETIPGGTYDLANVEFQGTGVTAETGAAGSVTVTFGDGASAANDVTVSDWTFGKLSAGLRLYVNNVTTAPITLADESLTFLLSFAFLECVAVPFVQVNGTAYSTILALSLLDGGSKLLDGGNPVVDGSGQIVVLAVSGVAAQVENDTVAGTFVYGFRTQGVGISTTYPTQSGLTNVFDITAYDTAAANLGYTPGNGAHWTDPDPTTVAGALDRIAAAVYAAHGAIA